MFWPWLGTLDKLRPVWKTTSNQRSVRASHCGTARVLLGLLAFSGGLYFPLAKPGEDHRYVPCSIRGELFSKAILLTKGHSGRDGDSVNCCWSPP